MAAAAVRSKWHRYQTNCIKYLSRIPNLHGGSRCQQMCGLLIKDEAPNPVKVPVILVEVRCKGGLLAVGS